MDSMRTRGMSLTTTRRWRVGFAFPAVTNIEWCGTVWTTFHDLSFTVAGVVTVGGVPVADGGAVKIYADDGTDIELIASVVTSGGTGSFAALVSDDTRSYFAVYSASGNKGWSGFATPGASFNITIAGSGGGGGGGGSGLSAPPIGSAIVRSSV
jgi:hypothetical protein